MPAARVVVRRSVRPALAALCSASCASASLADTVALSPVADATLFQEDSGALANGAGIYLFAGLTIQSDESLITRRALLKFDLASAIPAGSTIHSATLTLRMSRTIAGDTAMTLHRAQADWGEGATDAPGQEGAGAPALPGSATWIHTFSDTAFWANPGGDFDPTPSASATVGFTGFYDWTGPQLAADAQSFLDDPAGNFGWILLGNEIFEPTAKRFDSRENPTPANRPVLTVDFTPPAATCDADLTTDGTANGVPDGAVTLSDFSFYLALWSSSDPSADITADAACAFGSGGDGVTLSDFSCYLSEWSAGCP